MKKIMVCHPRSLLGRTVHSNSMALCKTLRELGYDPVYAYIDPTELKAQNSKNPSIHGIAKSIELLATCDSAYFGKGWENARGCIIEHEVATRYGLEILYEEEQG